MENPNQTTTLYYQVRPFRHIRSMACLCPPTPTPTPLHALTVFGRFFASFSPQLPCLTPLRLADMASVTEEMDESETGRGCHHKGTPWRRGGDGSRKRQGLFILLL